MKAIIGWDRRRCEKCKRQRVHYRSGGKWHCIGTLKQKGRVSLDCGKQRTVDPSPKA